MLFKIFIEQYKSGANNRKIDFKIDYEFIQNLWETQTVYVFILSTNEINSKTKSLSNLLLE